MSHKEHLKPVLIENLNKNGGFVYDACAMTGIHPATYYRWAEEDMEFKQECEYVIEKKTDEIKKSMRELALGDKHFPAMKYIIETRYFRERELERNKKLENIDDREEEINELILERSLQKLKEKKENAKNAA